MDLQDAGTAAERRLEEMGVALKFRKGAQVFLDRYRVANSYKYGAESTMGTLERGGSGNWFLIDVRRSRTGSVAFGANSMSDEISIPENVDLLKSILRAKGARTHTATPEA